MSRDLPPQRQPKYRQRSPYLRYLPPHLMRLCPRVLTSIQSAKASHAQLPDMSLRSDTQALRLIASIPLIQRKEKHHSREGKSAFTQWFSSVFVRSLKRPGTSAQISTHVDIRATYIAQTYLPLVLNFYPYAEQQPNIGHITKLYRNPSKAIQESK